MTSCAFCGSLCQGVSVEKLVVAGERLQRLHVIGRGGLRPGRDGAATQRQRVVGHDQRRVDHALGAEPVAGGAGAVGIVEGEQARLDLGDGEAGDRAGELLGEDDALGALRLALFLLPCPAFGRPRLLLALPRFARMLLFLAGGAGLVGELGDGEAVGELERGLEGIGQPGGDAVADDDAVDDHLDVVLELLVERRGLGDLVERAVDLDALEAALHQLGQLLAVLALAAAHDRRQQIEPRALGQRQHAVDHLGDGLALDRQAGRRRIGHADAGEEEPHVVVDLGDRADRRARIAAGRLLLDGDGRRQAVDLVDVRLLHHLQELAGIGRQALDIAALALGIDGVEGERRLAGARQAGEHDQPVARQVEVDILEVVFPRPADGKELARGRAGLGHGSLFRRGFAAWAAPQTYALRRTRQAAAPPRPEGNRGWDSLCCQSCQEGRPMTRTKEEQCLTDRPQGGAGRAHPWRRSAHRRPVRRRASWWRRR